MLHFISLFALLLPQAQAPSAADFMPADTFLYLEASLEPFDRLGEDTVAAKLFQKADLAEALAPLQSELQTQLDELSVQLGFDLGSLIGSSRFSVGLTWGILQQDGGHFPIAVELSSAVAQGVDLAALMNSFGVGVWAQVGNVLLGVVHTEELDQLGPDSGNWGDPNAEPNAKTQAMRKGGASYLQLLLDSASKNPGQGMTGLESWKAMAGRCRTNEDLFAVWLLLDHLNRDLIEEIIGEEIPDEMVELAKLTELDKMRGFGWAMNVAPPMLEDRIMVYGPGLMRKYFPAAVMEASNLPELMKMLPHDSWQTVLMAGDFPEMGRTLKEAVDILLRMEGGEVPPEAQDFLDVAYALLAETGPVFCANTRMEDYSRGLPGDVWVQASHPEKVREALNGLPDGLNEALDNGMSFVPGMPSIMLAVRGNRVAIFESVAQSSSETLASAAEYQSAATHFARFPVSEIYATEFLHRDLLIDAMNTLRVDGNDLLGLLGEGNEFPLDFSMLPNAAVVQALMPSSATVSLVNGDGYYSEGASPFGRVATMMLVRIPTALKMLSTFGLTSGSGGFDEEEF